MHSWRSKAQSGTGRLFGQTQFNLVAVQTVGNVGRARKVFGGHLQNTVGTNGSSILPRRGIDAGIGIGYTRATDGARRVFDIGAHFRGIGSIGRTSHRTAAFKTAAIGNA